VKPLGRFAWERLLLGCELPRVTKLVGLALAVYANRDGSNAHPGNRRLAAWSQLTERAVKQHLATLRDLGLIERTEKGHGNRFYRRADCYQLTEPADLHDRVRLINDPGVDCGDLLEGNDGSPSSPVDYAQKGNDGSPSSASRDVLKGNADVLKGNADALDGEPPFTPPSMSTKDGLSPRMDTPSSVVTSAEVEGRPAERPEPSATNDPHQRQTAERPSCECGVVLDPDGSCFACSGARS
jgi:DNA-binding transcriptional ArsR family regulator